MRSKTAFGSSMKMVERLDRSREHFLTLLQLRARSADLAIANVPNSRHCDIPPQKPQCPAPFHFRFGSFSTRLACPGSCPV